MRYLLDTNSVIAVLKGHPGFLVRMRRFRPRDFALPSIVAHELFYGAYKGKRIADNLARIEALRFEVLEFDREDARRAGELRAELAGAGTAIGPYDVLIAGQAIVRGLTLITHNVREFQRVPALLLEDWQAL
ncbi:type II toxin-antitoxin system VapC family toxin [Rhodopila sp.]|uniref:type II toxin-antitoxin system VapC family toxin n=1 Tax=Rhodopila sp. TaxID=2480087 RepID=UPI003D11C850